MKKIYFWSILTLIIATFFPTGLLAQERTSANGAGNAVAQRETHVTPAQALNVGYTFMRTGSGTRGSGTRSSDVRQQAMQLVYTGQAYDSLTGTVTDCYYVFALQPKGFVIVAADDRVEPILGYSYDNDFAVANMPDHVRVWLGSYERQIEAVTKSDLRPTPATESKWTDLRSGQSAGTRSGGTVGPLLTTTWDQGQYYNSLCPTDASGPAGHVYTGCVSTAMAQIIHYWGYPVHGRGTHSYLSDYGTLTVNYANANYDYTLMPDALTSTSTTQEVNAVASLMRDCGVAVNMGYSPTESSSFDQDARAALINFYRFSPNLSFAEKAYFSDSEWNALLHADLDNNRPVFYSGQGSGGHAFVCDGYNADGYYHFNFGWGGFADGWFLTSSITPGGSNFNDDQAALFGIVPDSTGNVILGQTKGTSTFTVDEPLEFYHLMGHNAHEGSNYANPCNNKIHFIPADSTYQIVADILDYEDQTLAFYDGENSWLRNIMGGANNDYSPVVSSLNALKIAYSGNMYSAGFKLSISQTDNDGCRMVSNITSAFENTNVHLTWTENGTATQWQIEYGLKGFELGTGTIYTADTNAVTFSNLPKFTEYDFYIRPICGTNLYGLRNKITAMVEAEYWQDIVTSQPAGYVYNAQTKSVEISTAEGLAWWAKNVSWNNNNLKVYLTADIDLSGYKWRPVNLQVTNIFIDGRGHRITHAFIRENADAAGLFNRLVAGGSVTIENLGLTNFYVKGSSSATGGLGGYILSGCSIRNCYISNSTIEGTDQTGGLIGHIEGPIINCYANVNVVGNRWVGLMIGTNRSSIRNCYAAGTVRHRSSCYMAGITSYSLGDEISNCYSVETEMGVVGYKGSTIITDTSTFKQSNAGWDLLTPVVIDDVTETDLLSALNNGVKLYNDSVYCTWVADTGNVNGGYPVFGNKHVVQCPNETGFSVQNATVNNNYAVVVSWTENSNASQWRIRYRRHDMPDSAYTYVTATSNPDTIFGIPLGYSYDFNVRAICDANNRSGWSETQNLTVDLPYWTDIVTTQPVGYVEDANGNVEIYSTEGLAWLSAITNGLHNQQQNSFSGKTVSLKSDIDLNGYRWYPISFSGTFDGQNHNISNIYINGAAGLFGVVNLGSVKNVHLIGGNVIGGSGGLIGTAMDCYEISNCHSSATVYGDGGALCGGIINYGHGPTKITVSNCSSSGTVYGREGCGNLIGTVTAYSGDVEIRNCYATGNVNSVVYRDEYAWHRGGLIGYVGGCHVENCFSTGNVEIDNYYPRYYGKVLGALDLNPHVHYLYGQDNVNEGWNLTGNLCEDYSNSSEFHHNGSTNALLDSVYIDGTAYFDLLDALNAWVISQNDSTLRLWILDSISGYPVFGDYYVPSCYNPTDLTVSQATVVGDSTIKTRLSWSQSGNPDHWEVLYVASGRSIDSGSVISVSSNPCVLAGIPIGHSLDFYVRSVCNEDDVSGWCGPVTYIPDKLHWTEVVTSQPEGYYEDTNGNVYISSAEGLSWISSITNELNGTQHGGFSDKQIFLTNDIDLSAYRWTAIGNTGCSFNGNNHIVSGLYCNELSDHQGLFSSADGEINNLLLSNCNVSGSLYVGGLAGAYSGKIVNCIVNGTVSGYQYAGGIVGSHSGSKIENSCFIGNVSNRKDLVVSGDPGGYSGGICGLTYYDTVENCYVVGDFSDINHNVSGIVTGIGGGWYSVLNCYYKETGTDLPITSGNQANNSAFSGSGYTWTLNSPPYIGGSFHPDLLDALNTWVDAHNTNGQYHRWTSDTAMANGGYPIFESVSYPAVITQDTVLASGYYCWHGMVFTTNTTVTDTIPTPNGYDSIITHHIIVTPALLTEIIVDTCNSYIWNSETYSRTGDYVQTFPSAGGVDSVVVLRLTINPLTGVDEYFICDDSYTWIDGVTYIASNHSATYTQQTADGCDSVTTLHLTVGHSSTWDTTVVTHTSFDWYEYTNLTQSGDYTRMLTNANGCDSVVTLHLTVITPPTVTTNTVSDITASSAFCGGNVTADGGAEVTERGVCWSTSQNPTIADNHIAIGVGTGAFTVNITGLAVDITYHVRAYATNSKGTAYGEEMTFTTTATPTPFTCGDGLIVGNNKYTTNQFGTQCWMTQNLRNADESYQFEYPDILQVCPTGWHLPDNDDWDTLGNYLPSSPVNFGDGDYWTTTTIPWSNGVTELTLIAPPYVQSNNVFKNTNFACEIHDAARGDCLGTLSRVFVRCLRGDDITATLPSVTTDSVINITATTATCGGNVTSDGGADVTERGVCWSTSQNPTVADAHTSDGTGTGVFTSQLIGLEPSTTYHVRAYSTNRIGTTYGEEVTFTTGCPPVDVTITSDKAAICEGECATLHASGADSYIWSSGENSNNITDCPTATTTYSVTGFDLHGCESSASFTLMVNDLTATPSVTVDNASVCDGSTITLSITNLDSNPSTSYTWYRNGVAIPGTTQAILVDYLVAVGGETTNYAYTVMASHSNSGCVSGISEPTVVTVNVMNNTELFETACDSYTWNDSVYTQSGDYTQTFTNANGCDSVVTLNLTVNHSVSEFVDTTACHIYIWNDSVYTQSGDYTQTFMAANGCDSVVTLHLTINNSNTGDTIALACDSYDWYEHTNLTQSGDYARTLTNANGCDSVVTLHLTIFPTPEVIITTSETNICIGGTTTVYADAVGEGNISYSWSVDNVFGSNYTFAPDHADTFTFTVTATNTASGCQGTNSITINVNDLPETPVVTVNQATVFEGGQVTLTVANPVDGAIYTWYRNGMLIDGATQATLVDTPTTIDGEPATYAYSVIAVLYNSGCVSEISDNTEVTVFPTPVANVTVNGNTTFCEGSSTTLHVDVVPQNGPTYSYQWYEGDMLIPGATSADYVVAEPARTTSYYFHVVVSANGSDNVTAYAPAVTVVSLPTVVASISESTVCAGGTATLTALVSGGVAGLNGLNNYSYQWFRNVDSTTELVGTDYAYTTAGDEPAGTYTYWVAISNQYGCNSQSESVMFTVADDPTVTITPAAGYNETVCDGGSTVLQANTTGGFGEISYQWYKNGLLLIGENNQTLALNNLYHSENYSYTVSVTQTGVGCAAISAPQTVNVNAQVYTTLYETACDDYTWNGVSYAQTGEYTQTFIGANGCDSVVTLYLIVNHANTGDTSAVADDMFDWYEHTYLTQSGDYTHVFTNQSGCDSVVTLHLTVNNPTISVQDTVLTAGYFIWHGIVFTSDTVLFETIPVLGGYDSLVVYHVFVTPTPLTVLNVDTCVSYTLNGQTYAESGDYVQTFPISGGMDSVVVLYLTVNQPTTGVDVQTACGSYTWIDGITYTESNSTATFTLTNAAGCDSVVSLNLTIFLADSSDFAETACESFTWEGTTYTSSGDYTQTFTNVSGCDSVVTLHLTVNQPTTGVDVQTACDSFSWHGITYTESGAYQFYQTNANGCDSVLTLLLTIFPTPDVVVTASETSICVGGTTTINANAEGDGNISYSWSFDNVFGSNYTFDPDHTGTFTFEVTATDELSGCSAYDQITIHVNDVPETPVVTTNNATIFEGGQVTLTVANPVNGAIYTWYRNGMLIDGATQSTLVNVPMTIDGEATTYVYSVMAALYNSGCVSDISDNTEVAVFPTPVANVTVNGNTTFCEGSSTTLHVDVVPQNGPTYSYQWYEGDMLIPGATSADYVVAEPARTTSYYFHVVVSANGSDNVTAYAPAVTVVSLPTVVASISESTVCAGGTATLTALVSGGVAGLNGLNNYSYQWFRNVDSTTELVGTDYAYTTAGDEPAGTYTYWVAISNQYGCNSQSESVMFTVADDPTVTITPAAGYNETVCDGGSTVLQANTTGGFGEISYQWYKNGLLLIGENNQTLALNNLYHSENYSYTVSVTQTGVGCAAISAPQTVNVNAQVYTTLYETACDDYTWNGVSYAQTGEYTQTFIGANGCDSVVTLYLIVNHANTGDTSAVADDMFDWYEHTYLTQSGDYTHVFTNQSGCDSVVTLHLTVNNPTISVQDTVLTAGYFIWHGIVFTSDTVLFETIPVLGGYDSLVVYHVFVTPTPLTVLNVDTCVSYTLNGQTYAESGDYVQTFPISGGMDSVVVLYLTVNQPTTGVDVQTACGSYTWIDGITYTESNSTATFTLTNAAGCDSVVTLHLTIFNPVHTAVTAEDCGSYVWNGMTYTVSGDYTYEHLDANGCTQVDTLHLTIFNPVHTAVTAEDCGSYVWNGLTYTVSGDYTYEHLDANGCTQVDTLHLTIFNPVNTATTAESCGSYDWNGQTYTVSGDYTQTLTAANGCDSVVTLHLTVHPSVSSEFSVECPDSCYIWNGESYCQSGDYTQTLQTVHGCDSVVTLHLTITVGIDDHNLAASMTVYPNPTTGIVNVQCTMNNVQIETMEYHVFDVFGKLVDVVMADTHGSTAQFDLSGFANGVYLVKAVADGNVVAVRKVVKQ